MARLAIFALLLSAPFACAAEHWAYVPPAAPTPGSTLDAVVERHGLAPAPAASPATLLRRVTLDLTGLPPTPAEAAAFLAEPSDGTYAQVVERLLASPRFGERWAAMWLDLARFADTQGYEKDNLRTIWAYRDWVIKAFNDDLPYDRFTCEQLAGDLLPEPTPDQLTATAFHRNTLTNTEGGADAEEFRVKAVLDRVNTTWTVWMGTTLACAQCHDHPSEPITRREYYQCLAFFDNTADENRGDDAPVLAVRPLSERPREEQLRHALAAAAADSPEAIDLRRELEGLRETSVPIMRELPPGQARVTHVFERGQWLNPGEAVQPGVPALFPLLPVGEKLDRLAFAHWLVDGRNPLPARVMVNRLWAQLFGSGLVETEEDFGTTGARPVQQPLLDWLAAHFQTDWRWSVKRVLREIVLSQTYRESSAASASTRAVDPANLFLTRGARFRLPAEAIRDQALASASLLSDKMYGRSVMPPQPEGVWQVVYNIQRWVESRGEDRYRRGVYTFWRRSSPYPSLALFDAPSRETCVARRLRSNSPAGALVTLNDPVFVEAAEALGQRMEREGGTTDEQRLRFGWRLLLVSEPSARSLAQLCELLAKTGSYREVASALLNLDATLTRE